MNFTEENPAPEKKRAPRPKKRGNTRGVKEWEALDSAAHVRRYLRWLVQSMRDGTLRAADCHAMRLVGEALLSAIDTTDIEETLEMLKGKYEALLEEYQATQRGRGFRNIH